MTQDPASREPQSSPPEPDSDTPDAPSAPADTAPSSAPPPRPRATRGFLDLLLVLVLTGLTGANYLLYRMQQDQQAALTQRLNGLEQEILALKQQSEHPELRRSVETVGQEMKVLRRQVAESLTQQQESMDRLWRELQGKSEAPSMPRGMVRQAPTAGQPPAEGGESPDEKAAASPGKAPEEEYVDFVESTGAKAWRWIKESAAHLWGTVTGWFGS